MLSVPAERGENSFYFKLHITDNQYFIDVV